ncbi:universal stress protein [Propylenella binzhouense]|uniref:Universal stress protein n=1 Tax=Propylenella binzhouense TaxID=2555902 RepID=A0A964WV01_9HYPH|nr:universal stress protein [Propylenella binzhouense]MYZ49548.1 universal stress protein [Propylenella binzhouense]
MKTILVPYEGHDRIEATLATACVFGRAFDSYIEAFPLSPPLSPFLAADTVGAPMVYDAAKLDAETKERYRLHFDAVMRARYGEPATASGQPRFRWTDEEPAGDAAVGSTARVFDVTVVGRPGTSVTEPRMATLEAALFDSGRPILIAPPETPETIGRTIAIAWNRSPETARAVAFAKPVLRAADKVFVIATEGGSVPGPSGDALARYLRYNDIACELVEVGRTPNVGEAILSEAARSGADLVVKGAYTQSRLRQIIFGGATRHLIYETTIPVLLAH